MGISRVPWRPLAKVLLAMDGWRLGNLDAARDWYAKANDWMKQHRQNESGEIHRFRTEAEKLFGYNVVTFE